MRTKTRPGHGASDIRSREEAQYVDDTSNDGGELTLNDVADLGSFALFVLLIVLAVVAWRFEAAACSQAQADEAPVVKAAAADMAALSDATRSARAAIDTCAGHSCPYGEEKHLRELVMQAQEFLKTPVEQAEGGADDIKANTERLRKTSAQAVKLTKELTQSTKALESSASG
ncbi:hypothetical protein H8R18_00785 [Nanchangia anserum]|uniref:Uncharacterized protein n=1 Tax=Nanchangia anserum TaxID=2692125 RepID=A0A8I0G8F3_9ACTO|nr:hypothetical protein [Nanchangia anserum]MBD3689777.1 hypothetical protein [Nanchangia anserum]QOX81951.1 hypothetical protein H8R18_00785 [Nanchangia anserum]